MRLSGKPNGSSISLEAAQENNQLSITEGCIPVEKV